VPGLALAPSGRAQGIGRHGARITPVPSSIGAQVAYRAPVNRAQTPVPLREVLRSVWTGPRLAVRQGARTDAARLVIAVASLAGVLDGLQNFAVGRSLKPHWGAFAVLFALALGPLLGLLQFAIGGALIAVVGRRLGGSGDSSDVRVALACSRIPELVALPFWIPVIAVHGVEMFEEDQPYPLALAVFMAVQGALLVWSWVLRVIAVAEAHDFSCGRALVAMVLAWLVPVVLFVAAALAVGALTA
jgi:hypothetical protein